MLINPPSNNWIKMVLAFVVVLLLLTAFTIFESLCNPLDYEKEERDRAFREVVRQLNDADKNANRNEAK